MSVYRGNTLTTNLGSENIEATVCVCVCVCVCVSEIVLFTMV